MKLTFLLILCFYTLCTTVSADEQFLLRVDTVGYIKSTEDCPEEIVLNSIEVMARPNETFHCKVQTGPKTEMISGKLYYKDGEYSVQILYAQKYKSYTNMLGTPVFSESEARSTVKIDVGKSATIMGGYESTSKQLTPPLPCVRTKKNFLLFLSRYESATE